MKINTKYDILTPDGFEHFDCVNIVKKASVEFEFHNRSKLRASFNHKIYKSNDEEILMKDVTVGMEIKGQSFNFTVTKIKKHYNKTKLYDVINSGKNHLYISNGIISHNCAFLGSGDNVIDGNVLRKQETENVIPPVAKDAEWEHNVWIWKAPEAGHRYISAIDVSRGDSEDATGYCIIDFDTWEQVVEYHGKITPDIAALLVNKYSIMYNALTTCDITGGMGVATTAKLKDLKFPTKLLHYDKIEDVDQLFGVEDTIIPGINFASYNRRTLIVQALEEALRTGFRIRSERLCAELKKFIYKNGRADHMKNSHDDLIMALGMCLYVANTSFKKLAAADSATKAMLESWKVHNTPVSTNPAISLLRDIISSPEPHKKYDNEHQLGSRQNLETTKEFSWLFGDLNKYKRN